MVKRWVVGESVLSAHKHVEPGQNSNTANICSKYFWNVSLCVSLQVWVWWLLEMEWTTTNMQWLLWGSWEGKAQEQLLLLYTSEAEKPVGLNIHFFKVASFGLSGMCILFYYQQFLCIVVHENRLAYSTWNKMQILDQMCSFFSRLKEPCHGC